MKKFDVTVIGGGPSGCASALMLKKFGHNVCLIERSTFPRWHLGESLLSMSLPLLKEIGILKDIENSDFLKKYGSLFVWGPDLQIDELLMPGKGYAWQVERSRFDHIMYNRCKHEGIHVINGNVSNWIKHGEDTLNVLEVNTKNEKILLASPYIIDASGATRFSAKKFGIHHRVNGLKRMAVYAQFPNVNRLEGKQRNHIISEATRDGWLWFIPLRDDGLTSIGFVGEAKKWQGQNPKDILFDQINKTQVINKLLKNKEVTFGPGRQYYYNSVSVKPVINDNIFQVGDALMFVDPLFSTGVHSGLYTGTLAARCIDALITKKIEKDEIIQYYKNSTRTYYNRTNTLITSIYLLGKNTIGKWFNVDEFSEKNIDDIIKNLGPSGAKFYQNTTLPVHPKIFSYANHIKNVSYPLKKLDSTSKYQVNKDMIEETIGISYFTGKLERCHIILSKSMLFEPLKLRIDGEELRAYNVLKKGANIETLKLQNLLTRNTELILSVMYKFGILEKVDSI